MFLGLRTIVCPAPDLDPSGDPEIGPITYLGDADAAFADLVGAGAEPHGEVRRGPSETVPAADAEPCRLPRQTQRSMRTDVAAGDETVVPPCVEAHTLSRAVSVASFGAVSIWVTTAMHDCPPIV